MLFLHKKACTAAVNKRFKRLDFSRFTRKKCTCRAGPKNQKVIGEHTNCRIMKQILYCIFIVTELYSL